MKSLLNLLFSSRGTDVGLLILRVCAGIMIFTHGWDKIIHFDEMITQFADPIGLGSKASFILVIFAEFICAGLLVLGLLTRLAAIPLVIDMGVAAFIAHAPVTLTGSETPLLYLVIFLSLVFCGAGKYSLDGLVYTKINCNK